MTFDPTANDLTTVARLKPFLEITDTANDGPLQDLVTGASNYFLQLISRPSLYTQTYTEVRDGRGTTRMMLRNFPITAVSSVTINGISIPASSSPFAAGYVFDGDAVKLIGFCFEKGYNNVTIVYTAGYPVMAGSPLVPQDYTMLGVERGVIAMCAAWWKRRAHWDEVSRQSPQGITHSFQQMDVPKETQRIANQIQRIAAVA